MARDGYVLFAIIAGIIDLVDIPATPTRSDTINSKVVRFSTAILLAFGSLFWSTPVSAEETQDPMVMVVTTPGGDDSSYQVPLTTTITFDGVQYDSVYVTTNSVITFGRPDGTYWDYPQTPSISLYSMDWVVFPWSREDEHLVISASDGGFQVDISARPIWLQNATEPTNINIVAAINTDGTVSISYSLLGPTYDDQTRTGVRLTNGDVVTLEEYGIIQVEEPPVLEPEPVAPTPEPTPEPEPLFLNAPTSLSANIQNGEVFLTWNAPAESNTSVEGYDISWSTTNFVSDGWGWNHDQTSISIPLDIIESTAGLDKEVQFAIRADNNTEQVYSDRSSVVSLYIPSPIVAPTVPDGSIILVEGESLEVIAPEGQRILSIMAWYGDPDNAERGIDVSSTLTELASGETSVTIDSSNAYGDPAPGTVKVLIVIINYEDAPIVEPIPEETLAPQPEGTVTPQPEPTETQIPEPEPTPTVDPSPIVTPEPAPAPVPVPTYTPEPEPIVEPIPEISETPSPEPTPSPSETSVPIVQETTNPTLTPTPSPSVTQTPIPSPQPTPSQTSPQPSPTQTPSPTPSTPVEPEPTDNIIISGEPDEVVSELLTVDVEQISDSQIEELKDIVAKVFASAEPGSEEYEQALEALAVLAVADDPELPEELAAIPLIGDVAGAVLEVFNDIGNVGADMSPEVRATSEKIVVASVIVANIAITATAAATSAAAVAARRP